MEPVRSLAGAQAEADAAGNQQPSPVHPLTSKKVSDHLANERTFLAWVRTGIAVTAFGFVIERFGLLVRELGLKVGLSSNSSLLSSKRLGIVVPMLGILMLVAALFHFVQVRRTIEKATDDAAVAHRPRDGCEHSGRSWPLRRALHDSPLNAFDGKEESFFDYF